MTCHLCGAETHVAFSATVLGKHEAHYHYCDACDHVFVDQPTWLEEAYADAIVASDTDIAVRNVFTALRLAGIYYLVLGDRGAGKYVDVAGGYGLLTRLVRDLGFDCYWSDPYATNLFARGFEYEAGIGPCVAVSAVEVLEHTPDPLAFIRQSLDDHQSDTLVFTTEVFPDDNPPSPPSWAYYALDTGQHIAFFSRKGLSLLAARLGMHYFPLGRLHLFSRRALPAWKLRLASSRLAIVPLALWAGYHLGSKRGADQTRVRQSLAQK